MGRDEHLLLRSREDTGVDAMTARLLNGHAPSERRELLKRYLVAGVRDNVLTFADITRAPDKLMRTITADIKATMVEIGRSGAGGILKAAGGALAEIAQDVVAGRRK
jgi:hypothetical protein